jgi:hypothetical protein
MVLIAYFSNNTWEQFRTSSRDMLGNRIRCNYPAGTPVALMNLDSKQMMGIARLVDAPSSSSPCIEHHLLDSDIYSGPSSKYNKFEIHISDLRIFKNPVDFDELRLACGGDDSVKKTKTNIWKGAQAGFQPARSEDPSHVTRFKRWIDRLFV